MRENKINGPNLDDFENNWNKWAAYVLNSIHELKYDIERIFDLLTDRDTNRAMNCPYKYRIETIEQKIIEQDQAIMHIRITIARWAGAIIAVNAIVAAGATIITRFF